MYSYDTFDQTLVEQRAAEFRAQVARRLSGELTEEHFRPLRLLNGLYLQLHAYMLRVAIPYGTLSSRQLHALANIADKYDRGYGHFTTRQNIQYNWIKLEESPDILNDLAAVEMHAIQTSGNVIRNVTADHFAGVIPNEADDPRITCEVIRQWSTLHPEFSFCHVNLKSQSRELLKIVQLSGSTTLAFVSGATLLILSCMISTLVAVWAERPSWGHWCVRRFQNQNCFRI